MKCKIQILYFLSNYFPVIFRKEFPQKYLFLYLSADMPHIGTPMQDIIIISINTVHNPKNRNQNKKGDVCCLKRDHLVSLCHDSQQEVDNPREIIKKDRKQLRLSSFRKC